MASIPLPINPDDWDTYVSGSGSSFGEDSPPSPPPPPPPLPPGLPTAAWVRATSRASILPLLTGDPATRQPYFSAADDPPGVYVLNPDRWCAGIDLTGLIAAHDQGGGVWGHGQGGCLVTPLHAVTARHDTGGGDVRFVAADGTVHQRSIVASRQVWPAGDDIGQDAQLITLSSPLPGTITPVRIFTADYTYPQIGPELWGSPFAPYEWPGYDRGYGLWIGQNNQVVPCQVLDSNWLSATGRGWDLPELDGFAQSAVSGNSGSVVVVALGGVPVLWTVITQPTIGPGYFTTRPLRQALAALVAPNSLSYFV